MCPATPVQDQHRGYVIPIGGAEAKRKDPEILERFVELCGGSEARILVIPTASLLDETGPAYQDLFQALGVKTGGTRSTVDSKREDNDRLAAVAVSQPANQRGTKDNKQRRHGQHQPGEHLGVGLAGKSLGDIRQRRGDRCAGHDGQHRHEQQGPLQQ